jgi:methylmalonyl-CoA mutase N-terminal domain/subunit
MSTTETAAERPLFYGPGDAGDASYEERLGDPGEFPYTRGTRAPRRREAGAAAGATMIRELSGEGSARRSNEQFHHLLEHGAGGLDVIGDAPTVAMMDPDHPFAAHAVGNTGVSLCRAADYRQLLADVPLDRVSVSMSLPSGFAVAGLYLAARDHGFDPAVLRGSAILGPLYGEDTAYSCQLPHALHMRLSVDSIEFATARMPRFHPYVEDTYFISDGSIEAIDEMALGFVQMRDIVRRCLARGMEIDAFAPRIALLVNCRMDVFQEIAKIRAARRMYARMMRDEFGARDPRSLAINVTAHTSGATMQSRQLMNNVVRGAVQTLALYMAGVHAMEISAFDEAIRTPSPEAHVVALRTQQVVALESGVGDVADPLGGSYYVEALTDEIEERVWARVAQIESLGDPLELAEQGFFRGLFAEAMVDRAREVSSGERPVVGVNVHTVPPERDTLLRDLAEARIEPSYEVIDEIRAWKAQRDLGPVGAALTRLEAVGRDREANLMEPLVDALEAEASVGECIGVLRQAYGWDYDPLGRAERPA